QTNRRPPGKTRPERVRKICLSMENAAASPAGRFRRHSRRRKCPTLKAQTHTKNRMPAPATIRQIPLFFPNRLQVSPIRRVMPPPPFKGNARVNGFAVGKAAGYRYVS
ncbi:TPA: hypothetical protein ACFM7A_000224, partial [Neisseria meningitidis]